MPLFLKYIVTCIFLLFIDKIKSTVLILQLSVRFMHQKSLLLIRLLLVSFLAISKHYFSQQFFTASHDVMTVFKIFCCCYCWWCWRTIANAVGNSLALELYLLLTNNFTLKCFFSFKF